MHDRGAACREQRGIWPLKFQMQRQRLTVRQTQIMALLLIFYILTVRISGRFFFYTEGNAMILPMENTEKMIFPGVGKYGIPEIKPETDIRIDKLEWIPVNYALTAKDKFGNYKEIESMHGANMSVSQIADNAKKNGGKVTILKESDFKKEDAANKANQDYINKHQIDYSLGYGLGPGFSIDKAARKRARMSRLANRRRK